MGCLAALLLVFLSSTPLITTSLQNGWLKDPVVIQSMYKKTAHQSSVLMKDDDSKSTPNPKYKTDFFEGMPVDHFGYANAKTFSLKYLYNLDSYAPGGPVLFYTGNEGNIEVFAEATGIMFDLAQLLKAAIVFGEHRYYGKGSSMPLGDDSLKSIASVNYLTTQQALADYATLIPYVKQKHNISAEAPVIAIGGSYGGMLAAWFRMKYPNVVAGAWAASAPVLQFRNGGVAMDGPAAVIKQTFNQSNCQVDDIAKARDAVLELAKKNVTALNEIFQIETKSIVMNETEAQSVLDYVDNALFYLAMTNYPYAANFLKPLPAWPVEEACKFFPYTNITSTAESLVIQLQKAVNVFYNTNSACVKTEICGDQSTSALNVDIPWNWQYCSEIVISMCNSGPPNDFYTADCNATTFVEKTRKECPQMLKAFGLPGFTPDLVHFDAIEQNYGFNFGGASNIIFTNGQMDPWSAGGVTEKTKGISKSQGLYVYWLEGGAHHLDLRQPNTCDMPNVVHTRRQIVDILKCWTGISGKESCEDAAALQQPLPAYVKMNDALNGECNFTTNAYPWTYTDPAINPPTNPNSANVLSLVHSVVLVLAMLFVSAFF